MIPFSDSSSIWASKDECAQNKWTYLEKTEFVVMLKKQFRARDNIPEQYLEKYVTCFTEKLEQRLVYEEVKEQITTSRLTGAQSADFIAAQKECVYLFEEE